MFTTHANTLEHLLSKFLSMTEACLQTETVKYKQQSWRHVNAPFLILMQLEGGRIMCFQRLNIAHVDTMPRWCFDVGNSGTLTIRNVATGKQGSTDIREQQ